MDRTRIHLNFRFSFFIILIASVTMCSLGQTSEYNRKVDKSTIFYLFKNRGFAHLNSKLVEFQKEYEENYLAEENLYGAFEVFSKPDATFEPLLNEWISQFPASFAAYTARAKYFCACAWKVQRQKWALEKEGKEYDEMMRYFSLALLDIAEALKQNLRSDVCYALRIEIAIATGNEAMANSALAEALTYHPYAYRIRLQYIQMLAPRWGGTYQKMDAFIDSCKKVFVHNEKLKELIAAVPADKGRTYSYLGKYEHAVKMFTEALNFSNMTSYYIERGDAYARMRNYKAAVADYEYALKLSPNDPDYLDRKLSVLNDIDRIKRAQKMNTGITSSQGRDDQKGEDQSLVAERQEVINHIKKGSAHLRSGRFQEGITEFNEAIRLSPGEYNGYYYRALCYQQLGDAEASLQDLLKVIELKPDDASTCFRIMKIYADRNLYDEAINFVNKAISLDPNNGDGFYYRSKLYERKGNNVEALDDMRQSCNLGYEPACRYYKQVQ